MEKWEHLLIRVVRGGVGQEYLLEPRQRDLQADVQKVSPENSVALLNELGESGWQLVMTDVQADLYWMKRRTQ